MNRIKDMVDTIMQKKQMWFRTGRRCRDQIFTTSVILEDHLEKQTLFELCDYLP